MLSLVNYGASDSENEITDEEDGISTNDNHISSKIDEQDDLVLQTSSIRLPQPSTHKTHIAEEDDEFLHKKAVPSAAPPKKEKVKIMIPRLSDFKDDDDDDKKIAKIQPVNKKAGLLSMLPRPSNSFAPSPKPSNPVAPKVIPAKPALPSQAPAASQSKKVGLIPYSLMSHNTKAAENKNASKKKDEDSDDDNDDHVGSFFTFASKDEDLPKVNDEEIKALVAKETARMEQRKRQHDEQEISEEVEDYNESYQQELQQQKLIDEEAMRALLGGNKAKRSKLDNIQIIELSAAEVLPNKTEWRRKNLAGETSYIPTGNIQEKGPNALSKRKHQISYLSVRAENNEAELEAMWATNRQTQRESKSKYGF